MKPNKPPQPKLDPKMCRRLKEEAERRTLEAAEQLLHTEEVKKAAHNLAWVAQANRILRASQREPSRLLLAASIAIMCIILAGLALGINAPNNALRLNVQTHSLSFALSERSGQWQGKRLFLQGEGLMLENIAGLELRGIQHDQGPYNLDLYTADYYVSDLNISAGTWVDVDLAQNILSLSFKRGTVSGTLRIKQAELVLSSELDIIEQSITEETGEVLQFQSAKLGEVPLVLKIDQVSSVRPVNLQATELQFLRPDPPGSLRWVSTILKGDLMLLLNEKSTRLLEGDHITFEDLESERLLISPKDGVLNVSVEGQADQISAGPKGYEKNLAPTLLEYFYYQQQLALFWSAVIFLWGLFWSLRNLI